MADGCALTLGCGEGRTRLHVPGPEAAGEAARALLGAPGVLDVSAHRLGQVGSALLVAWLRKLLPRVPQGLRLNLTKNGWAAEDAKALVEVARANKGRVLSLCGLRERQETCVSGVHALARMMCIRQLGAGKVRAFFLFKRTGA